jgi:hypothetical protein
MCQVAAFEGSSMNDATERMLKMSIAAKSEVSPAIQAFFDSVVDAIRFQGEEIKHSHVQLRADFKELTNKISDLTDEIRKEREAREGRK